MNLVYLVYLHFLF